MAKIFLANIIEKFKKAINIIPNKSNFIIYCVPYISFFRIKNIRIVPYYCASKKQKAVQDHSKRDDKKNMYAQTKF
jgi:hypothetical protein